MYQPDAAQAVKQLARALRPGGLVAFHEHDTSSVRDDRMPLPLHDQIRSWLREMLRQEEANLHMGFDLALAHKLARASYHILKEGKPFDVTRCFA